MRIKLTNTSVKNRPKSQNIYFANGNTLAGQLVEIAWRFQDAQKSPKSQLLKQRKQSRGAAVGEDVSREL